MIRRATSANIQLGHLFLCVLAAVVVMTVCSPAVGQNNDNNNDNYNRAVGGISIDADGLLNTATPDALGALSNMRGQTSNKTPAALNEKTEMRKISLRQLEAALSDCIVNGKPIPEEVKYLAGMQRIQYIFVYPEQKDIVLVGVGEGWKVDAKGNVVGVESGLPTMLLDDLLVALRTGLGARQGGITCSIDPTPEGLKRMNQIPWNPQLSKNASTVKAWADARAEALGLQQISLHGIPADSHFARVMVAADYRMKRIAMNLEKSPVRGLPSYLKMAARSRSITPRFWLEPSYEAIIHDNDGLAFQLQGSSVKAMTEDDYLTTSGNIKHSGKANRMAQKWSDMMTKHYSELAVADPIFGELHNCMDLAVVGALIARESLLDKAGLNLPTMMDADRLETQEYNAPKNVESQASVMNVKGKWVTTASGGVAINSWIIVEKKLREGQKVAEVRSEVVPAENSWWWN